MPDTPAARQWRALVEEHAASGLTNKAFAAEKNVNPRTLAWWRSKLKHADTTPQLPARQPMFTEAVVDRGDLTVVLALESFDAHIVVDHDTDLALLRRLLEAVA
jgi:hypothetical protein